MSLLAEDLRMAGFLAQFNPYGLIIGNSPVPPPLGAGLAPDPITAPMTAMPDPCATDLASLRNSYFFHVQGDDNSASIPTCVTDARAGSDILVIRRVSTCVAGPVLEAGCEAVIAGTPYFQSSNCNSATELARNTGSAMDYQSHFVLDSAAANLIKTALNCATQADYRRYLTRIYFVANNNVGSDGVPTLKRAELGATGFTIVPLVEGIETIQFEYGIGNTANSAQVTDYTANPGTWNACAGASCLFNWLHVYAVKVNLLARNVERSPGHTDTKSYTLGLKADGTSNDFGPYNDGYKRHAYTAAVRLDNPSGRVTP